MAVELDFAAKNDRFGSLEVKSIQRALMALAIGLVVAGLGSAARADLLTSYSGDAYVGAGGGPGAGGAWYGEAPYSFDGALGLMGTVEWEVFAPATFNSVLGGNGYTAQPNELVYAFQVENTGASDASTFNADVIDPNPFDHIGYFNLAGGVAPSASSAVTSPPLDYAQWYFPPNPIPSGGSSVGLAYSSPNAPANTSFGTLVDFGLNATATPLPEPSTTPAVIPEPGTLALLAMAVLLLGIKGGIRPWLAKLLS
jgi:hypothetical protein